MSVPDTNAITFSRRRILSWAGGSAIACATLGFLPATAFGRQDTTTATMFLDVTRIHDIAVSFDQGTYDTMIEAFTSTGDKEWIEATVEIDGSSYENVGVRLKGNSSLSGLGGGGMAGGAFPGGDLPEDMFSEGTPEGGFPGDGMAGGAFGGATAEEPERLPWLFRLDRNVDGQNHEGLTELVIRSNASETSLNEATALELLDVAGLASQRAAAARFSVNESAPVLRLAIENPNDAWMAAHFSADGLLYKGEAGGDYSYRGEDQAAYKDIFELEAGGTGDDDEDMAPLIEFLDFINNSDDQTFEAEIEARLNIDGFVTYLAMMDLIANSDDIDGPGNNAYLYVGAESSQFVVVPWDMNLAFGGLGSFGSDRGRVQPDEMDIPSDLGTPVAEDGTPSPIQMMPDDQRGGGAFGRANALVERTNALPGFADRLESERLRLQADLYESGTAADVLATWVTLLQEQATDLVSEETITSDADAVAQHFT